MTDEHYRAINRAIVLVGEGILTDDNNYYQGVREAARTALHHIFGREKRLREFSKVKGEIIVGYQRNVLKLQDENTRLREELGRHQQTVPCNVCGRTSCDDNTRKETP